MASDNVESRRGRKPGEKFASASDVFMAILTSEAELRKLSEEKSISYNALVTAKEMLTKAGSKVPSSLDKLIAEKTPTSSGSKTEPPKVGEVVERYVSLNRAEDPVLMQLNLAPYKIDNGDSVFVSYEKDKLVITFKPPK